MIFNEIKNYRFPIWLTVFLFLLVCIPVFIFTGFFVLAKVTGILLVCAVLFALKYWFAVARNRNNVVSRIVLNNNDLFDIERDFKSFSFFEPETKNIIVHRIGLLLAKVKFVNSNLELLDRRQSIQLAFVYICVNWSDEFYLKDNWVFKLSNDSNVDLSKFKFVLSTEDLSKKFIKTELFNM